MSHPYSDIPELARLQANRGLIRIPMEQDVPFTPRVRALVDCEEFQRLGHVTQLGLASRVYPGATHTRFEHALGVFHNALQYLWQLGKDERFAEVVDEHAADVLLASALLHDLGHWPFCHPIEDLDLPDVPPHEQFAAEFLGPSRELSQVLRDEWRVDPAEVLDVLVPTTDSPKYRLLRSIISGPIDIDKMDYLERDSLHAGVPYGRNFDKNRLIQSLLVNEAGDGLAISEKGKTAAELMVFARYVMFSEVYWHHAVRSATCMLARAFFELHQHLDLSSMFVMPEPKMIDALREAAAGTGSERLTDGIFGPRRQLYKRVGEFSHYQSRETYAALAQKPFGFLVESSARLASYLQNELGVEVDPTDILIDAPPKHREIEFAVEIYFAKENVYRALKDVSPVVDALARRQFDDYVKRVRIFAQPRLAAAIRDRINMAVALDEVL